MYVYENLEDFKNANPDKTPIHLKAIKGKQNGHWSGN
jgi:hypothetical protein